MTETTDDPAPIAANPSGSALVCPRCGEEAEKRRFCDGCGLNLAQQAELPNAEEYAARLRQEQWLRTRQQDPTPTGQSAAVAATPGHSKKEPGLAILFSFFFAGAGEIYAGDSSGKTIGLIVVAGIAWLCAFTWILLPVTFLCIPAFIYSMVNSSRLVKQHNARIDA